MKHLLPLRYIDAVSKAGSIRKAAETLSITSTALNRRILAMLLGVAVGLVIGAVPGLSPPMAIAVATPAILPVPTVADKAVQRA